MFLDSRSGCCVDTFFDGATGIFSMFCTGDQMNDSINTLYCRIFNNFHMKTDTFKYEMLAGGKNVNTLVKHM